MGMAKAHAILSRSFPGLMFSSFRKRLFPDCDPQTTLPDSLTERAQGRRPRGGWVTQTLPQRPALGLLESQEGLPERFRCGQERSDPGLCPERQEWGSLWPDPRGPLTLWWQTHARLRRAGGGERTPGSGMSRSQHAWRAAHSSLCHPASSCGPAPPAASPSPRLLQCCLALPDSLLSPKTQQPGLQLWWKSISKAPFTAPRSDNAAFIPSSGPQVGPMPSSLWL